MTDDERAADPRGSAQSRRYRSPDSRRRGPNYKRSVSHPADKGHAMTDTERRIEAHAQEIADAAPPLTEDQKTAVRRAARAGRASEWQQ